MDTIYRPHDPPAGRRVPRPETIEPCPACGDFLGRGYRGCPRCHEAVGSIWRADRLAFLAAERAAPGGDDECLLAGVVVVELTRHPWTIVDYALTFLRCDECGAELGGGPTGCATCAHPFGNLWAPELEAGTRMDEHAIRVGRLNLSLLLTGALSTTAEAQRLAA